MIKRSNTSNERTFRGYYDSLPDRNVVNKAPKSAFIDEIAKVTLKSTRTVRCWLAGSQKPDALTQAMIEKELNIPATELFPEEE